MKVFHARAKLSPLDAIYTSAGLSDPVRRSLNLMMLANLFGNLFGIICGSGTAAMVGLANELRAGDLAFGLISGIPQAAMLLQIPFAMLVSRTHRRKRYILTYGLFSRAIWVTFGLIPMLVPDRPAGLQLWTMISLLALSSCCSAAINVCWFPWFSDLAPERIRGHWFSVRDTIVAGANFAFGIAVARLLDTLPQESRFVVIFAAGGFLGMMDMICFGFCEERYTSEPARLRLSAAADALKNRPFRRLILMWTAWCFTTHLCEPYLSRYSINVMGLSFTQMTVCGTAMASVMTILAIRRWGRAMDGFGSRSVMLVATVGAATANLFYLFSTPGAVWPVLLRNAMGAAFWCGSNLAANNMQLYASPDDERPIFIAVFSCVTAIAGVALGSLTGGLLLEGWEAAGWFTGFFDRYKALIALSTLLRLGTVMLLVPPLMNDRDGTPRQLLRALRGGGRAVRTR